MNICCSSTFHYNLLRRLHFKSFLLLRFDNSSMFAWFFENYIQVASIAIIYICIGVFANCFIIFSHCFIHPWIWRWFVSILKSIGNNMCVTLINVGKDIRLNIFILEWINAILWDLNSVKLWSFSHFIH